MSQVSHHVPAIDQDAVIRAGAFGLESLAPDAETLRVLQDAYSEAINKPLMMALIAASLALPFALSMKWQNVKVVAEEKVEHEIRTQQSLDIEV